jgi:hypothetical protein
MVVIAISLGGIDYYLRGFENSGPVSGVSRGKGVHGVEEWDVLT